MSVETRASIDPPAPRANRWLRRARALAAVLVVAALAPGVSGCGTMENVQVVNDPFLGPTRGFIMYLDFGGYTGVSVKEAQGKYTLQVMVVQHGVADARAAVGDKTEFLVGGKVITLENAVEAQPVANARQGGAFTQWQLTFNMDAEGARRFAAGPLTAIKAHVGGMEFQMALPATKAVKFQQNLALMTSPPGAAAPAG
jgi:hypothetical protein